MVAETLEKPQPESASMDRRPKILIVDDDDALTDVLSSRLEQQGFEAIAADSGQSGLAKARSGRPALIVLDLQLPDTDGFTVCEELADSSDTCAIPVIVLSGMERPDILRRCRSVGCHYFVRKPYDPNVLLLLIQQAIQEAGSWPTALE